MAVWAICIRKQKGGGMRELGERVQQCVVFAWVGLADFLGLGESGRLALTFTAGAPSVRLSGNGLKEATA